MREQQAAAAAAAANAARRQRQRSVHVRPPSLRAARAAHSARCSRRATRAAAPQPQHGDAWRAERQRARWNLRENNDVLPLVVESDSFSEAGWQQMRAMAEAILGVLRGGKAR
jgi:hypothetical protein